MTEVPRCQADRTCTAAEVIEGRRYGAVLTDGLPLCGSCVSTAARAFSRLPHDWLRLKSTLGDVGGAAGEKVRSTPTPAVPINVAAEALMARVVDTMKRADATVRYVMRMDAGTAGRSSASEYRFLLAAALRVVPNVDRLVAADRRAFYVGNGAVVEFSGADVALLAVDVSRRVRHHLGETRQRERQHLPCPRCRARAMFREVEDRRRWVSASDGAATPEVVRCAACHGEWTEAEYKWLSRMVLSEREELELLKWLLAEAQWQRDVAGWLAAERHWALQDVARVIGLDGGADALIEQVRRTAVV